LSRAPFIVVADLTGAAAQGRILLAAEISADEIEAMFKDEIASRDEVFFDAASASLRARSGRRLGAIALTDRQMKVEAGAETAKIFAQGLIAMGLDRLPWGKPLAQFRNRVMFLRKHSSLSKSAKADVDAGEEWPDFSDEGLAARAADWLEPLLMDKTALSQIGGDDLSSAVTELLPWNMRKRLDAEAPTHFSAPSGSSVPIDYEAEEGPKLSIRVQELFGLAAHPSIAKGRVPLVIELLSPAHRPVQVTRDLPGFWRGSYADVKTEMKGRYPRHPWPEDPTTAPATRRAKPRGT
jgi:ATP-dependent helicase HrpB